MDVIITHEQADFDAIASLLGAHILQGKFAPLLPRKLNKNVKDFLRLYKTDLPFNGIIDLPKKSIDSVVLVDTQSLVTLKGITKNTKISIIDHHQKKEDLSNDWQFTYVPCGATTTYFVEQMMEQNDVLLNVVEATLLLLGIYEDTGMLTYTNTSARDASAVAYLLSKNANLEIATQFLNPPLSPAQQFVFQGLLMNSNFLKVKGIEVLIATTTAMDLEDEVSSIAHKINDLFDPDALFVIVSLKEGIRLVARSSNDRIDTSLITGLYGGGGHQRASAALIPYTRDKEDQLNSIVVDLEKKIKKFILPAVTVGSIMSKKPLMLSPSTTTEEARLLMEQYGYEGFPVVENGRVIGLLNRRAVDKAFSHNLKKTASSLMEAGSYFVQSKDSLKHLQHVMAESGWGQIPVVSTEDKEIIGIATRTDLLKALTGEDLQEKRMNLSESMRNSTSTGQYQLLKIISEKATELGVPIYIVGGFVRDLILHRPSPDYDIVVEGDAIRLSQVLVESFGGKVTSHKKFGTAKWLPPENSLQIRNTKLPIPQELLDDVPFALDLVSARTEFYEKPTALPTIKQSSIKLDLHRRDFSINTMAIRLDGDYFGDVYDYWGGLTDLENGSVRVLHSLSFIDDPTRIMRAVRFEKRFGFSIEERTLQLLHEAVPVLDEVSGDRIRHELDQIFIEENASDMMLRLDALGVLSQIHPSLTWDENLAEDLRNARSLSAQNEWQDSFNFNSEDDVILAAYLIFMQRLMPADVNTIIKRLRFRSDVQHLIKSANHLWHNQEMLGKLSAGEFTESIEKYPPLAICVLLHLNANEEFSTKLSNFLNEWRKIKINTSGDDLKKQGIPPGPIYKRVLKQLRIAKINGEIKGKRSEEKLLGEILGKLR